MAPTTVSAILAPGSLLILALTVAMAFVSGAPGATQARAFLLRRGPWLAFAIAAIATSGSLYYSEIAHYTPCEMCWLQRGAMYPLSVLLLIAAIRGDRRAWRYVVPVATVGLMFSLYHYQLELVPDQPSMCSPNVPCSVRWVDVYGFVSLAFMAGASFISILAIQFGMARARRIESDR
jgi:disulfide bond formation protein DsbB